MGVQASSYSASVSWPEYDHHDLSTEDAEEPTFRDLCGKSNRRISASCFLKPKEESAPRKVRENRDNETQHGVMGTKRKKRTDEYWNSRQSFALCSSVV